MLHEKPLIIETAITQVVANTDGILLETAAIIDEAARMVQLAWRYNVPVSLGIFEPGPLRWVRYYGSTGKFTPGTIGKSAARSPRLPRRSLCFPATRRFRARP